jgi:hypothetical protein
VRSYHEADLNIAVHHTDGGGVSDHVFALAALPAPFAEREVSVAVHVLNRMLELGRPNYVRIVGPTD